MEDALQRTRFDRFVLPHLDSAYNLARWLTGRDQDAEDVVQEACLRALAFFDTFRGEEGRAWLLTVVRHACYDWLRKNRGRAHLLGAPEELDSVADPAPNAEAVALEKADRRMVMESLERLPAEYREVLVLRELEGLSYKQIAQVTDTPIGTVMSRLARGRKRLEAALHAAVRKEP